MLGETAGGFVGKKSITQRRKGAEPEAGQGEGSASHLCASAPLRGISIGVSSPDFYRNDPAYQVIPGSTVELDIPYIHPQLRPLAVPIDSVCADPENENKHDARSIRAIAASMREFGQRSPIVVNAKTGFISAGNGRHAAAKTLGWDYIAVVATEDDEAAHAAWRISDNRTADFSDFDEELLQRGLLLMKEKTPDLFLDLELAELEGKTTPKETKEVEVKQTFALLVDFETEAAQRKYHDKWTKEGLTVQVRTI